MGSHRPQRLDMPSYHPRVAIVTGAAQGIGLSIAQHLARDGIDIAVNDIPSKALQIQQVVDEIKKTGRNAIAIPADITSEEEVKAMVETTARELGSVDIMIANAGIVRMSSFLETTMEDFDAITAVNFRGVFLCYQYAAKQMIKEGHGGRIIGASSCAGKEGLINIAVYSGTKFAVRGITQTAAKELGEHGITVNAYAPGMIATAMIGVVVDTQKSPEREAQLAAARKLMGLPPNTQSAEPGVVGNVVSFLCKPESHFITGQTISVDGGLVFS
ncbi:NAD-binding protein [Schizopora paradoxa]|uniref:3-oxoacyl-[acyl-carrier-protein] reductase n=1 Tax=Schizopora paradoxa TaxID=27342 RepID=A0A0H2R280_9AGAM|nr:NAD-binding protein [Schizopora paradoxa]